MVTDVRNFVSLPNAVKYWQQVQSTHNKETFPTNRSVYITDVRVFVPQTYKKSSSLCFYLGTHEIIFVNEYLSEVLVIKMLVRQQTAVLHCKIKRYLLVLLAAEKYHYFTCKTLKMACPLLEGKRLL